MKTLLKSLGIARRKSSFGHSDSMGLMDEPAASSAVANSLGVISEAEETDNSKFMYKEATYYHKQAPMNTAKSTLSPPIEPEVASGPAVSLNEVVDNQARDTPPPDQRAALVEPVAAAMESILNDASRDHSIVTESEAEKPAPDTLQTSAEQSQLDDVTRRRTALKRRILAWQSEFRDTQGRDPRSADKKADPSVKSLYDEYSEVCDCSRMNNAVRL